MKDVVTAAPATWRVLVTGFGPFPGAPSNPTLEILKHLERNGVDGFKLAFAQLPVTFAGVRGALRQAAVDAPDLVLLLGLATRRRILSVETRARNAAGRGVPDADGHVPSAIRLAEGGPVDRGATWPAASVVAALRQAGHEAALSHDAGDYVCNAALFHALGDKLAPVIGFLHVPPTGAREATSIAFADAARIAIAAMAPARAPRIEAATSTVVD